MDQRTKYVCYAILGTIIGSALDLPERGHFAHIETRQPTPDPLHAARSVTEVSTSASFTLASVTPYYWSAM